MLRICTNHWKNISAIPCNAVLSYVSRCECIVYRPSVSRFVPPSQWNSGDSKTPGLAKLFTFPLFWCVYIYVYIYIFQFWYISKYKIDFLFYCFDIFTYLFTFPLFWYIYIYQDNKTNEEIPSKIGLTKSLHHHVIQIATTWRVPIIAGWWLTYPSEKWWSSSVGMMTFPIYGKIMFQTTNQIDICCPLTKKPLGPVWSCISYPLPKESCFSLGEGSNVVRPILNHSIFKTFGCHVTSPQ